MEPICVYVVDAVQGEDVVRGLARRGLPAAVVLGEGGWQVKVVSAGEEARTVLADIGVVLAALSARDVRPASSHRHAGR